MSALVPFDRLGPARTTSQPATRRARDATALQPRSDAVIALQRSVGNAAVSRMLAGTLQRAKVRHLDTEVDADQGKLDRLVPQLKFGELQALQNDLFREVYTNPLKRSKEWLDVVGAQVLSLAFERLQRHGKVQALALSWVDGVFTGSFGPYSSGEETPLPKGSGKGSGDIEMRLSQNDAEARMKEEVRQVIYERLATSDMKRLSQINLAVIGSAGPCDGCKKRMDQLAHDIISRLSTRWPHDRDPIADPVEVRVEYAYVKSGDTERHGHPTRYGWDEDELRHCQAGKRGGYKYHLEVYSTAKRAERARERAAGPKTAPGPPRDQNRFAPLADDD